VRNVANRVRVKDGLDEVHLREAAVLYEQAFGQKIKLAIASQAQRLALFEAGFCPEFAVSAEVGSQLVGLAGFNTGSGSLTGGIDIHVVFKQLGFFKGLRAITVLMLYDRKPKSKELLMDGISVSESMRGKGIGTRLLDQLISYAHNNEFDTIRLDVIDTNDDARRLYQRRGFVETKTEKFEFLRAKLGFGGVTTMIYTVVQ